MAFFFEQLTIYSLLFLLVSLSLDCFYELFPLTGYRLLLANLVLIGCTTYATFLGIKWAITLKKPLQMHVLEKSEFNILINFLSKYEGKFCKIFKTNFCLESFRYSTNVNEQTRLLIMDIERAFIKIWYSGISQNPSFLLESHLILEEICHKIIAKLKTLNFKKIIMYILLIYLDHLQQYKKLKKKLVSLNCKISNDVNKPKIEILDLYQFVHPASNNYHVLNYYFKKITKSAFKEFAPLEFSNSLECNILSGIIGKKMFQKFLITLEDPNWINLKLIYLLNSKKHKDLLQGKSYSIKFNLNEDNELLKKILFVNKRLSVKGFEISKNLCISHSATKRNSAKDFQNIQHKEKSFKKSDCQTSAAYTTKTENAKKSNLNININDLPSSDAESLQVENVLIQCQSNTINQIHTVLTSDKENDIFETITVPLKKFSIKEMKVNKISAKSRSTESLISFSEIEKKECVLKEKLFGIEPKSFRKLKKTKSFDEEDISVVDLKTLAKNGETSTNEFPLIECNRDVSPVYEESEDFATTIAKLRTLLQQHESSTLLLNKNQSPEDSQHVTTFKKPINKYAHEESSFDSSIECNTPKDGNLYFNISIPKIDLITDNVSQPYILYSIQYNGIYTLRHQQAPDFNKSNVVVQTTLIKRRFQDFLNLQTKLEENVNYKHFMKEVTGPKVCLNFSFAEDYDNSSSFADRSILENFLRQLCSNANISNSLELKEFLDCNSNETVSFTKKDYDYSSLLRLDKLLGNKFAGVFNSLKTVLPSFDFDAPSFVTTNGKQELFHQQFNFVVVQSLGDSLVDDIRQYLREKNENVEDAIDALNSTDWLSEQKECRFLSSEKKCLWSNFKEIDLADELELLDSSMPLYSLLLDIISELLQETDSWIIKEPIIRLIKVMFGHLEYQLLKELSKRDWDSVIGNIIKMLRLTFFKTIINDNYDINQNKPDIVLKKLICDLMSSYIKEFIKPEDLFVGVSLFVDSFQIPKMNRDILLRLFDLIVVHFMSCHHMV